MNRESRTLPIINGVCFPEEHHVCGQDLGCGSSCLNTTKSTKTILYSAKATGQEQEFLFNIYIKNNERFTGLSLVRTSEVMYKGAVQYINIYTQDIHTLLSIPRPRCQVL